jgi:hypothetical protein
MALSESRDVGELYKNEEYKQFAELLTQLFNDSVIGLINDIQLTHPYVGYTHFRDNVLAPHVGYRLGELSAGLILNHMIETGILETYKVDRGGEYQVSAIRKVIQKETGGGETNDSNSTTESVDAIMP